MVHNWYRFVLSFPAHLVRDYVTRFELEQSNTVLDPFCGTGTTLVECKKLGIDSVGFEMFPSSAFASRTKLDWTVDPGTLSRHAHSIAHNVKRTLRSQGVESLDGLPLFRDLAQPLPKLRALPVEANKLLLKNSISPVPLHKSLELLRAIRESGPDFTDHELLALASALVSGISNIRFGPEVGVGKAKHDAPVVDIWLGIIDTMAHDLMSLRDRKPAKSCVFEGDARQPGRYLKPASLDAVITSPPYPNEKDYSRTTRLESVVLGFVHNNQELRRIKKGLVRSNTRSVYKEDDDHLLVAGHPEVQRIAEAIEARRLELGKTSGFERQYARLTKLYFGGMARHLADLRPALKPGARLAYVVGDQASYLQVMIRTGAILADIAVSLGYEVESIDLFRTRLATATKEQLREEVVVLRWPASGKTVKR